jgi:four helix bundle protein
MENYKELKVWNLAMEVAQEVYELTLNLPQHVKFSFSDQITRSSLSIPSNIAEGAGRSTIKEYCRFLDISNGSCFELETQLILIERIFKVEVKNILNKVIEIQKMTYALKRSLLKHQKPNN